MPNGPEGFSELSQFQLDRKSQRLLPEPFCRRHLVVVLGKVDPEHPDAPVTVGMVRPDAVHVLQQIGDLLERPIQPVRLNRYEVESALQTGFGEGPRVLAKLVIRPSPLSKSQPSAVELVNHILALAVDKKASDIHIESYPGDVDVRLRIDGILHQIYTDMDPETVQEVVSRIKILAELDITERRAPQDGRIRAVIEHGQEDRKVIDYRVSVVPSPTGEDVVIRILDADAGLVPVGKLGMTEEMQRVFLQLLANPEGLVLVTGPTGSGKTTSLYSALSQLNDGRRKIITAEDPIEYFVPKVNQKQVSEQMSYATLLRALLRQDPNVLLVGEIRDLETGSTALNAARTGHLVLGTLHTADAVGAIGRLRGLELDDTDIADALLAILAQRLARRVCEKCSEEDSPSDEQKALFGVLLAGMRPRKGRGCAHCHHTGYRGRVGIFELLLVDPGLQDLIVAGAHNARIREHARERGFKTMVDDALEKIAAGLTTLDELIRVVPYRHILAARDERRG
ncbi:GspE/PulE family protein [Melittangium boletus]|uniref:General secretion pathway protein GspE n=1 Tax=Melittangium boletus DSM 14713 TaxID=1294270 RepID=A0A250IDR6_9BACT|nr:GspE/PulE family protein [Melittangium boletus]ATB29291.1 general secretion pathway protein GspE [Melittangium boletus DSM 14713]